MGSGSQDSASSNRPLTAPERSDLYTGALADFASTTPSLINTNTGSGVQGKPGYSPTTYSLNAPSYNSPEYTSPEYTYQTDPQMLSDGDLSALQQQMTSGYTSGLDYAKGKDTENLNADLAKRGVWSSGIADKAILNQVDAVYAPQYAKAGADATAAADTLQSGQLQQANTLSAQNAQSQNAFNAQNAGTQNTFNLANASAQNSAQWAPLNYLQGIWNGTGGTMGSGSSSGWNMNI
jgi:hypothetical protein